MNFNLTAYDLALIAGGFTIVGALLGNWINHRFSDYRDRRKEFNETADQLDTILRKERSCPRPESKIDFENFRRVLKSISKRKLCCFDRGVEEYEKAKKEQKHNVCSASNYYIGEEGRSKPTGLLYRDSSTIKAVIDKLLTFTERM